MSDQSNELVVTEAPSPLSIQFKKFLDLIALFKPAIREFMKLITTFSPKSPFRDFAFVVLDNFKSTHQKSGSSDAPIFTAPVLSSLAVAIVNSSLVYRLTNRFLNTWNSRVNRPTLLGRAIHAAVASAVVATIEVATTSTDSDFVISQIDENTQVFTVDINTLSNPPNGPVKVTSVDPDGFQDPIFGQWTSQGQQGTFTPNEEDIIWAQSFNVGDKINVESDPDTNQVSDNTATTVPSVTVPSSDGLDTIVQGNLTPLDRLYISTGGNAAAAVPPVPATTKPKGRRSRKAKRTFPQ